MKYLVDANILIQGFKFYYPEDVHKSFWNQIKNLIADGTLISIDIVQKEVQDKDLVDWIKNNVDTKSFYLNSSVAINEYKDIIEWSQSQCYNEQAKQEFADRTHADAVLIAMAKKYNYSVVTDEKPAPLSKKRIKIPDVCNSFKIRCMKINDVFRELKITI